MSEHIIIPNARFPDFDNLTFYFSPGGLHLLKLYESSKRNVSNKQQSSISKYLDVQRVAHHQTDACTFSKFSLNCPRWLGTVKGFPNAVIMAHSNSIYQQAKAITASIDFDYRLYAWMTLNLTLLHTTEGSKATFHQHKFVTSPLF